MNTNLILPALVSTVGYVTIGLFVWLYTRKLRRMETTKGEGETIESAVNAIATVAKARLDEIRLLQDQNAALLQQLTAQKIDFETRIGVLERRADDLEVRNSSLRRRLDRYEMQENK